MPTYRNPCATNPLLRKGGAHIRSKTGQRSRDHYDLLDEAAECMEAYVRQQQPDNEAEGQLEEVKGERDAPFSFVGCFISGMLAAAPGSSKASLLLADF